MEDMKKEVQATKVNGLPKQLYRSENNVMIAGVASGLAIYFSMDPTIIRVLFVVSTFFGGGGLLIYILMWIVIPPESAIVRQ